MERASKDGDDLFGTAPTSREQSVSTGLEAPAHHLAGVFVPSETDGGNLGERSAAEIGQGKLLNVCEPSTVLMASEGSHNPAVSALEARCTAKKTTGEADQYASRNAVDVPQAEEPRGSPIGSPDAKRVQNAPITETITDRPARPGSSMIGKPYNVMQDVMRKVRNHLSRHRRTLTEDTPEMEQCHRGSCQYVLNDKQVQDIVEIVFREMCEHGFGDGDWRPASKQAGRVLPPRKAIRKPSCLTNIIESPVSNAADPATTITEPETAYFSRNESEGHVRAKVRSSETSTTTILSRDGITGIRWKSDLSQPDDVETDAMKQHAENDSQDKSHERSDVNAPAAEDTTRTSHASPKSPDAAQLRGFSIGSQLVSQINKTKTKGSESTGEEINDLTDMTSFPPLKARHCTADWQSSPAEPASERPCDDSMYHLGIDARSSAVLPMPHLTDSPTVSPECDTDPVRDDMFNYKLPPCSPKLERRASEAVVSGLLRPKYSALVNSSGHHSTAKHLKRSKSTHFADLPEPAKPQAAEEEPGFLQKLTRKLSSVFQSTDTSPTILTPAPSLASQAVSRKASDALLVARPAANDQGPEIGYISEPEPSAVYQAMNLVKPSKPGSHRRNASEDNT
ncbi:hypothetical protein CTRI78_v010840 [Colletotrichum trifolii]|uniref:Uncharacterized protein n=1 Tax=Colletotrichum trifolii TaxID=5466 RepID=A0A4R8QJZ7_COLTR|nr:hypothetical protein CTRI78_v010840 [Colletotrichum trifolii]